MMTIYRKAKLRERINCLTKDEFDECFKAFNRWVKDNGYYHIISRYIFQPGVTKDSIRREMNVNQSTYTYYTFADVLILLPFINPGYTKYGPGYWAKVISPIHTKGHNFVLNSYGYIFNTI